MSFMDNFQAKAENVGDWFSKQFDQMGQDGVGGTFDRITNNVTTTGVFGALFGGILAWTGLSWFMDSGPIGWLVAAAVVPLGAVMGAKFAHGLEGGTRYASAGNPPQQFAQTEVPQPTQQIAGPINTLVRDNTAALRPTLIPVTLPRQSTISR